MVLPEVRGTGKCTTPGKRHKHRTTRLNGPYRRGVEPHSMTWVLGEHAADRTGPTWTQALQGFDALEQAVVDGGRGMQRGLVDFQQQRQDAGNATALEVSLDLFHSKQEAQRVLHKLWNGVEARWKRAEQADRQAERAWPSGGDRQGFETTLARAWKEVEQCMDRYDRAERSWKRIEAALELFRPEGRLNDRAWAAEEIAAAAQELDGAEWAKLRRALVDRRSLTFLDRMQRKLAAAEPRAELREALARRWWLQRQSAAVAADVPGGGRWLGACLVQTEYCRKLAADWEESYRRVAAVLRATVRASSAVECMNSVLRMHQGRHRTVTQSLLDLKRLTVLELSAVPERQTPGALPLRTPWPTVAYNRLVATAAHTPRRPDARSVKFSCCVVRRSQALLAATSSTALLFYLTSYGWY